MKDGASVKVGDVLAKASGENPTIVSPFDGVAKVSGAVITVVDAASVAKKYEIPGYRKLAVEQGDHVVTGDRLTEGSINLRQLMALKSIEETGRYMVNEILRIYAAQGQNISPQHLEVIVRQMFSRVQIDDPGDSTFIAGDIMSKALVVETNKQLVADGKAEIQFTQLLLGITKVSIYSDSFLSAASFQDTTRVLISAATSGRVDHLKGLKENVIIGRKIPVGTGVLSENAFADEQYIAEDVANQTDLDD